MQTLDLGREGLRCEGGVLIDQMDCGGVSEGNRDCRHDKEVVC